MPAFEKGTYYLALGFTKGFKNAPFVLFLELYAGFGLKISKVLQL